MKNLTPIIAAVLLVGVVALLATLSARNEEVVRHDFAFGFAVRVVGMLLAVVALIGLFFQVARGATAAELVPGGVVLLGSVLIANPTWFAAIGLGLVLAAAALAPRTKDPPDAR